MQRKIIHIDMDCFYASIEERDNPNLCGKPLAIGGYSRRSVLATCNYPARKFGVRSAMPTSLALQKCPSLKILPPRIDYYKTVSNEIFSIMRRYTEVIETIALDEAFLDVTECSLFKGSATLIAEALRADIAKEVGITASAGIAENKFLAKVASDENKPNGLKVVLPNESKDFASRLSLRKIPGVGEKTFQKLERLGLAIGEDVLQFSKPDLAKHFGKFGEVLYQRAQGVDDRDVIPFRERKSIGVEETYEADLQDVQLCFSELEKLAAKLQFRVNKNELNPRIKRLGIKIKFHDFSQTTVEQNANNIDALMLKSLFMKGRARQPNGKIRLLGVFVGLSQPGTRQLAFDWG